MNEADKTDVVRRLKSIEGHVGGIIRMAESDAYCIDLIQQIQAVQGALDKLTDLVLEAHVNTCVVSAVRGEDPDQRQRVLEELLDVVKPGGRPRRR